MTNAENDRLSQIATRWTLLAQAHRDIGDSRHAAFAELLPKYCRAIERYLCRLVGNDAAEDLTQEFAVRFLRGEFRHADPNRGRFRDYVKSSIIYLALAHRRKRAAQVHIGPMPAEITVTTEDADDHAFHDLWRQELLDRAWTEMKRISQDNDDLRYAVLAARAKNPDSTSDQLAERLTEELGRPISAANVRQVVHRARTQFAELLRVEVAATLPGSNEQQVDEELAELGLLKYFR